MDMSLSKLWEIVEDREAWRADIHEVARRHDWVTEQSEKRGKTPHILSNNLIFLPWEHDKHHYLVQILF